MKKETMKFEDKIKLLEKTINELESGEVDLEESIKKYTEAMKLVQECDKQLKEIIKSIFREILGPHQMVVHNIYLLMKELKKHPRFSAFPWSFRDVRRFMKRCVFFQNTAVLSTTTNEFSNTFELNTDFIASLLSFLFTVYL